MAPDRARAFAEALVDVTKEDPNLTFHWVTAAGDMGMGPLKIAGVHPDRIEVVHVPGQPSTSEDTRIVVEESIASGVELILFCGGDGTARDVAAAAKDRVPIVGIPAGVKMHSGLFAISPRAAANLLVAFLRGDLRVGTAEILDLDEEADRKGEWRGPRFATPKNPGEPAPVCAGQPTVGGWGQGGGPPGVTQQLSPVFGS